LVMVPVKAITRIYPQMSQMNTDEENYLCSSVTSVDEIAPPEPQRKLAGMMINEIIGPITARVTCSTDLSR